MLTAARLRSDQGVRSSWTALSMFRRRWGAGATFTAGFAGLLALLLVRNSGVFTLPVHPRGDGAANAIITEQAKHFDLLVGNYSRIGFSHPGPAFFYWQALGEWLCHDLLGLVPAPWNGQWLAALVLNCALVAAVLAILRTWSASWRPVAWCGSAALLFFATHDNLLSSTWMPYLYLAPFLLFLTAGASVAAGRTAHLWLLALAGGLLVHGHAEFLFFVPLMAVAVLGALVWRRIRGRLADWVAFGAVLALFLLPIALNLALHWPGEFGKYFGYGGEREVHGLGPTLRYVLSFWAGNPVVAAILMLLLGAAVAGLARIGGRGDQRRFLLAGLGMGALATILFGGYTAYGIDDLSQKYVGYFFWAVPLFLLFFTILGLSSLRVVGGVRMVRAVGGVRAVTAVRAAWAALAARPTALVTLAAALAVAGASPALSTKPENVPELPRVLSTLSQYAAGRPVVVDLEQDAWPVLTALIVEGDQTGQRVCAGDPAWRFLVTAEFVCTEGEIVTGRRVELAAVAPPGATVLAEVEPVVIWVSGATG